VFAALFGIADFATVRPTTSLTRTVFLAGGWALPLGLIGGAHQAGSALGAYFGGALYDLTGTYDWTFVTAAATLALAAALSFTLRERVTPGRGGGNGLILVREWSERMLRRICP
jgi:predicted MFS family arabinose efflux permease